MTLRVTVVVPVYNRGGELRQLVTALNAQSLPSSDWDLFICDDGSSEDLPACIGETPLSIRWLRQERCGPAAARNLGLYAATAPILAFTDSDCLPDSRWLESLIQPIESGRADIVGGLVGYATAEQWNGRCLNFVMGTSLGAGGARDPRSSFGMTFHPRTGNMAVRRELALAVGGFPLERYGEDVEFGRRVMRQGAKVQFAPDAAVVHNEKRSLIQIPYEAYCKGVARIRLTQRHGLQELIHAAPAAALVYAALLPVLCWLWPEMGLWMAIPGMLYLLVLGVLAIQGAKALKDLRAMVTVPLITVLLHAGYGLGYCRALMSVLWGQRMPWINRPVESRSPQATQSS